MGELMIEIIFFASVFLVCFAYLGYPLSLLLIAKIRRMEVKRAISYPTVTFIVTVHNEEKRIHQKLENSLSLEYPADKLHIVVASDGSTDRTNEIVQGYLGRGVELLALAERKGKESAQRDAVRNASGEILVFSDVATSVERDALRRLVSNFADCSVGCVSSEDRVIADDGKPSGEGLYVCYEMWVRALETRANSLVGMSGSLFAARKEVCADFSADMQSDFRTVLNSVKLGLRGISDPLVVGVYRDAGDRRREWERKVRTVVRGLTVFFRHLELLNPIRYGWFSYQLLCHKLLRWCVPAFLFVAFGANLALARGSDAFGALLIAQIIFYSLGLLGLLRPHRQEPMPVKIPAYFVAVNASLLMAWWRYLRGERITVWLPTRR